MMVRAAARSIIGTTFVVSCFLLCACATGYQPADEDGAGFSGQQVSKDTYVVAFVGNTHTSKEKLHDYAILFAAQLTTKHGYRYFMVTGKRTISFLQPPKYCQRPRSVEYFMNPEGEYSPIYNNHDHSATRLNAIEVGIRILAVRPATPANSVYDAYDVMRLMDKRYALNITPDSEIPESKFGSYTSYGCN